ncbi:hypothetical protein cypCar_00043578, partial [Cyprinus carpio]
QSHKEKKEPKRRERSSSHPDQFKPPESKPRAHPLPLKPLTERNIISADHQPQDSKEAYTYDPPQHQSGLPSHTHAPPTVNLNINLHTPANHTQPLNISQKETIFTLVSQALQWDRTDLFNPPFLQQGYPFYPYVPPNSEQQMGLAPKAVVSSPAPKSGVAYTLKDYKNMKQEVKLGGLGPTNTIPEAVAEKIRRQKLYSNVIREQNKKISRIPSLSAKDPVGSDNKDTVPRRKALEYAKNIAKPKLPPKPKDRPREQNVSTRSQYPQEMDPFNLATLEMLRRHEEEKCAVARFRTIPAI